MISFDKAFEIAMENARFMPDETIPFSMSAGRILAGDVVSDIDLPPFNKATVDGFACRRSDLGKRMQILGTIAAGSRDVMSLSEGICARIMTGAALPDGADMVFMVEESSLEGDEYVEFTGSFSKDNIAFRGEDVRAGETVLKAGREILPQDIAVLASVGSTGVKVKRKPLVAVISTGDELVEPGNKPLQSQIRNSNAWQLLAQVERAGAAGRYLGIARDDRDQTLAMLREAVDGSDIVVITGGVSMGDFDFIPEVMKLLGIKILFDRINIQPGKPTTFGIHKDSVVFGLPGNPVSSFMQFELLVRPLISRMMGHEFRPLTWKVPLAEKYTRRSSDRLGVLPVEFTGNGEARIVEYHGSAHISSLSNATGVIMFEPGKITIEKGETVIVRQI